LSFSRIAWPAVALVAFLAACGGGGGGYTPPASSGGTGGGSSSSAPGTSPSPASLQAVTLSGGGATGTFSLLTTSPVTAQAGTTPPSGITALAARRKTTLATGTPLLYLTVTATAASATLTGMTGSLTLSAAPTQPVYVAYWTGTEWDNVSDTAATVTNATVSFTYPQLAATIVANPNAYFLLYETGSSPLPMASASPSPAASSSAAPSASPSPSSSHAASPSPSPSAGANFVDTACLQTPAPTQPVTVPTDVHTTFFTTIVEHAQTICLSAWDLSSDVDTALEYAASHGASVTVVTPYSENSSNSSDIAAIVAAGGHAKTEYTGSSHGTPTSSIQYQQAPMDIHAKFALIDGVAYMDGHNWFSTDVILQDPIAGDFAAIQSDLENFPATPPSNGTFTTDKQVSLKTESAYLQSTAIPAFNTGAALEYDFITESFNPSSSSGDYNDDVYDGMCQIAAIPSHPTMYVIVEDLSEPSTAETALQNLAILDPNAHIYSSSSGQEKISMIRATVGGAPSSAWFGSSNATTTDLFDWGMDIPGSNTAALGALQSYYAYALGNASAIPSPSPATSPAPCASPHA